MFIFLILFLFIHVDSQQNNVRLTFKNVIFNATFLNFNGALYTSYCIIAYTVYMLVRVFYGTFLHMTCINKA